MIATYHVGSEIYLAKGWQVVRPNYYLPGLFCSLAELL